MRIIEKGETSVAIYDNIQELPADLHNLFNIAVLEDENIGSDLSAIESHNRKILDFLTMQKNDFALEQAKNQNFCILNIKANNETKRNAFCHLIHSINNIPLISRDTNFILNRIKEIPNDTIQETIDEIKKKLVPN